MTHRLCYVWIGAVSLLACGSGAKQVKPASAETTTAEATQSAPPDASADWFHSELAGLSLTKPSNWLFASLETEMANRKRVSVGNAESDVAMQRSASMPLVIVTRYPEPSEKPNPTLKVTLRPLGALTGTSAADLAKLVAESLTKVIPSFEVDGAIQELSLSGLSAAHFRAHFSISVPEQGTTFLVRSQSWVVPRADHFFVIAASDPSGGTEDYENDFAEMVKSIVIRN